MLHLQRADPPVPGFRDRIGLDTLSALFDQEQLDRAIDLTGCREQRNRRLPAHLMIRYVTAMGLYFEEPYGQVMHRLITHLGEDGSWPSGWRPPSAAAITQARQRLGAAPLKALFELAAAPLTTPADRSSWLGHRRLMAIETATFDVADSAANRRRFHRTEVEPTVPCFPKLHVAALTEIGTRAVVNATLGPGHTGRHGLAAELTTARHPHALILAAEDSLSFEGFCRLADTGADLAWQIPSAVPVTRLRRLSDGSSLSLLSWQVLTADERARLADDGAKGKHVAADLGPLVRIVEPTTPGVHHNGQAIAVATTVLDPHDLPADDLIGACHRRRREGSALKEISIELCRRGRALRSQSPDLVEQQMWGLLLVHYAICAAVRNIPGSADAS